MWGFLCSSVGKESACNAGDLGSIPGSGRSPGEGNGNPLQYSCLVNPMDRGAWQAAVRGIARVGLNLVTKTQHTPIAGLPWWLCGKESTCDAGDTGFIPGSERSPRDRNGNPLQCSLGNPMNRGA